MSSYDSANSRRRQTARRQRGVSSRGREESSFAAEERRRTQEREARRASRAKRQPSKSIGATSITMSGARNIGIVSPKERRPRGRGETARRVEAERAQMSAVARPAVYTNEKPRLRDRLALPSLSLASIPVPVVALVLFVISFAMLIGPVRTYYAAWRDAGILQAEYDVLATQNEGLSHELERLQTIEGIEDEARARGYVYPNEEALVVEGVEKDVVADSALAEEAVEQHEANLPWYVSLLDVLLGYHHE